MLFNLVYIKQSEKREKAKQENLKYNGKLVLGGYYEFVVIQEDGSLYYVGGGRVENEKHRRAEIVDWKDKKFINISMGGQGIFGVCEDGSIVGTTYDSDETRAVEQEVESWTNIKKLEVGNDYVLGLKEDGTVVAVGYKYGKEQRKYAMVDVGVDGYNEIFAEVTEWENIVDIKGTHESIAGLTSEGKVVLAGKLNSKFTEEIRKYDDIIDMAIFDYSIMVVHKTGKVSFIEKLRENKEVSSWNDIIQVVTSNRGGTFL